MKSSPPWRLLASCLGLSWAFHLSVWRNLYTFYGEEAAYYLDGPASWKPGAAVLLSSLALATAIAAVLGIGRRLDSRVAARFGQGAFLAILAIAVWKFTLYTVAQSGLEPAYGIAAYFACALLALAAFAGFTRRPDYTFAQAQSAALICFPLVAISTLQLGLWLTAGASSEAAERDAESRGGADSGGRRVVWVLFDELDSEIAFSESAPVELPQFAQMRREGFAHLAVEPSSLATLTAIPELTTGRRVSAAEPVDAVTLRLTGQAGEGSWTAQETIFRWAKRRGLRSGVAGWYHPYCRLFEEELAACSVEPVGSGATAMRSSLVSSRMPLHEAVALQAAFELRLTAMMVFLQADTQFGVATETELKYVRRAQLEAFRNIRRAALEYVADPRLDFVFVHLPVPHPVGIFDRRTGDYSLEETADYVDNLLLADRTLGEIREAVQAAGLEGETAVVVTSDHPLRATWRKFPFWSEETDGLVRARRVEKIPLFVHVPDGAPTEYHKPLEALVIFDLLRLLLEGGAPESEDWDSWMAARQPPSGGTRSKLGEPPKALGRP